MVATRAALGAAVLAAVSFLTAGGAGGITLAAAVVPHSRPIGPSQASTRSALAPPATTDTLFGLHWVRPANQLSLTLTVVDMTGRRWPVRAAAAAWVTANVRLITDRACRDSRPCVVVREGSYGRSGWLGKTDARPGLMLSFTSPVRIYLNDSYPLTARQRRAVACHELGHALGLGHTPRASSCLEPSASWPTPDRTDLTSLEQLYRLPG